MNPSGGQTTGVRCDLAVLVNGLLGLAASPAALAQERGGPGQPGPQQTTSTPVVPSLT